MKALQLREPLVLSLYLNTRGISFALFEGVAVPVDWGIKTLKSKQDYVEQARLLLHLFDPKVLVLQDCGGKLSRCTKLIEKLIGEIAALAKKKGMRVFFYSRDEVRSCFAYYGAQTKDEIAREIAKLLPEFERFVPPMRGIWRSEAYRMRLFDALALVITYYANELLRPAT